MRRFLLALAICGSNGLLLAPLQSNTQAIRPASPAARAAEVIMGRGDKRTKRGKRKAGSFGNARPRNAKIRISREGPGSDLGAAATAVMEPPTVVEELAQEPIVEEPEPEPVMEESESEPVVEEPEAPEPEPLKPAEIAAKVKELRAMLPKADLKECKQALEAAGFDLEAAKAAVLEAKSAEWDAEEAAKQAAIQEGLAKVQAIKDEKAAKTFEKEEAAKAAEDAKAVADESEPEPEPEPVVAEAAPEQEPEPEPGTVVAEAGAPAAEEAGLVVPTGAAVLDTCISPAAVVAKAGLSASNVLLLTPNALAAKAGIAVKTP